MYKKQQQLTDLVRSLSICKPASLLTYFAFWLTFLVTVTACSLEFQSEARPGISSAPESRDNGTRVTPSLSGDSGLPTQSSTRGQLAGLKEAAASSEMTESVLETETTSLTASQVTPTEGQFASGKIFVYESAGIQQISLVDSISRYILTRPDDWREWGARFAQNKKFLGYWMKTERSTELWVTSLFQWRPELLLELDETEYDFATPLWAVNDRFLLLALSILDDSGPLEEIKTIKTYVIDMETKELVNHDYWPGVCSILATSPQTSGIALWCNKTEEQAGLPEFLVLEAEGRPWTTQHPPEELTDKCLILATCAWSQDNQFVAFIATDYFPQSLFYARVSNPLLNQLRDDRTSGYAFPNWSPNSQFLYYSGSCADGTTQCPNIASVSDQEVLWRANNNSNRGEFGAMSVEHAVWSPDSLYLAIPVLTFPKSERKILLFSVLEQAEVFRLPYEGNFIQDLVWVEGQ